jgi:hypothetical protein
LLSLTDDDLEKELGIDAKLVRKTILNGIQILKENDQKRIKDKNTKGNNYQNIKSGAREANSIVRAFSDCCNSITRLFR